jgi:phage tail sheath protein FI
MAERFHPGVYVEERRGGLAPIQGVSTSNMGIVGFTLKGPVDVATLETSFPAFEREFGGFTSLSQVPTHTYAFFANGGRRGYIVRAVPSDAVAATGEIANPICEETVGTGDGTTKDFTSGGTALTPLSGLPVQAVTPSPGGVAITYYEAGTPVTTQACTPVPAPDGVAGVSAGGNNALISRIVTVAVAGVSPGIVPGTVVINTLVSAAPVLYGDGAGYAPAAPQEGIGNLYDVAGIQRGYIDYDTGIFNLSFDIATPLVPDAAGAFTADYTPLTTVPVTIYDDGAGALASTTTTLDGGGPNTIDYTTGAIEFKIAVGSPAPANKQPINVCYSQVLWDYSASSQGEWGNDLSVDVRGDDDFFTRTTAVFSRYDVLVYLDGELDAVYEDVSFTDTSDTRYVGDVINNVGTGSSLIEFDEPSNADVGPRRLSGYARSVGCAAGNGGIPVATPTLDYGSTDGTAVAGGVGSAVIPVGVRTLPLDAPVQPGSVSITYTDKNGTARTITDDGSGYLIGDVDGTAPSNLNVIDYTTGHFSFRVVAGQELAEPETSHGAGPAVVVAGSVATAAYYKQPDLSIVENAAAGGSDGASPGVLTRNELTDPALLTDRDGMYALLVPNELMNVTIPDAAGNVTMSTDQITEAERNGMWFVILATPPGLTPQQAQDYRVNTLGANSSYAALYYPYITITDPVTDLPANIPPGGHIAGIYARVDNTKSVGKAPAGVEDGKINFSIGLERTLEFAEIDILYPKQINALIDTAQTGRCVWGARTLENPPSDFRFIHVRRLFNFLKASIFNSTHGFVFESVGAGLRKRIKLSVESFLLTLYGQGLFKGDSPQAAFSVICDESNNPEEVENSGTVICDIYVAANVPGEFIVFRIQQKFTAAE